jgi:hypothetical protein
VALRNIAWHLIKPGHIVNFIYKSKGDAKGYKRTVLILNPDYSYRKKSTGRVKKFVIGLVLDTAITTPITETKLERLFKQLGGLELEDGSLSADLPDRMSAVNTTKLYNRLKTVVSKYDIWRSYDRRECRKRRVYLEIDYKGIPKDVLDKFNEEIMESKNIDFEM